jgi:hypothetical protein
VRVDPYRLLQIRSRNERAAGDVNAGDRARHQAVEKFGRVELVID